MTGPCLRRRHLSALAGIPVMAACSPQQTASPDASASVAPTDPSTPTAPAGESSSGHGVALERVATVSDVPVGGGIVLQRANIVLTQPVEGEFRAYSATCTHAGCQMASVTEQINCGCHGSTFALADGANTAGPNGAAAGSIDPLTALVVEVRGSAIWVEV